jgi:hypothetical protein
MIRDQEMPLASGGWWIIGYRVSMIHDSEIDR